jgi:hypothetical protein
MAGKNLSAIDDAYLVRIGQDGEQTLHAGDLGKKWHESKYALDAFRLPTGVESAVRRW